jgi:transcriptional regulator of acetoin/glycerol metabolism
MQKAAEAVNFIEGGYWDETPSWYKCIGTVIENASNQACVFSNEHYMTSVHDWVCYATPYH